jgi:uncharacterized phage protein gp47/JayE
MPFQRKTLSTLISEIASDIASALQGADALLRFTVLKVVGKVQAAMDNAQFGYLDWIAKQAVPFTAEDEYLQGWAALKNVILKEPTAAALQVAFPDSSPTTVLDVGWSVIRGDGATYTTNAVATVDGTGVLSVAVTATAPGSAGNTDDGTVMRQGTAVAGIQSTGSVVSTISSGSDVESNDELRTRMLGAYQKPPQGGDRDDYEEWALDVPGVTRAWVAPNNFGPGTVVIFTMFDNAESSHGGFPQGTNGVSQFDEGPGGLPRDTVATGDQLVVADGIIDKQPVTALVYSCTAVANALTLTISGLTLASAATRADISSAIADVFFRNGDPRAGTINRSDITDAIGSIAGTAGYVITLVQGVVGGVTTAYTGNITSGFGQLPVLAGVNYV